MLNIDWQAALEHLVPIAGVLNARRRASDDADGPLPWQQLLASVVVAVLIGFASGGLSAYITVQVMMVKIDALEQRVSLSEKRQYDHIANEHVGKGGRVMSTN